MPLSAQPVGTALLPVCDSHIAGKSHLVDVTPGDGSVAAQWPRPHGDAFFLCCTPILHKDGVNTWFHEHAL